MAAGAVTDLRSPSGALLTPLEHDLVATFEVTRGTFTIPARLLEDEASEADEYELRVLFAKSLPDYDPRAVVNTSRRFNRDGSATVAWRRVVTRIERA